MTRIALLSDIHGNAVALEAVLADIAVREVDELVCLGDVAAGGPQPREALARVRDLGCPVVLGNADTWLLDGFPREPSERGDDVASLAAIVEWARDQLRADDRRFLSSFRPVVERRLEAERLLCFHGSPRSPNERILAMTGESELEAALAGHPASIHAGGHTHLQLLRRIGQRLLVNPGSVGLPLACAATVPSAADYAIVEVEPGAAAVEFRRIGVDGDAVMGAAMATDMPHAREWAAILSRRIARRNADAVS